MRVHLVDGTVELFRCFHGAPLARTTRGEEVGACRGVLATFAALLRDPDVTHVAVTFDSLTAPAKKEPLESQIPLAVAVVRALGVVVWPSGRFSADELLASGARRYRDEAEQVVICTTDLDNAQCVVGDRVIVRNRITRVDTNEEAVRTRFGVSPAQLPDLFALVGDKSDGIAGLPGFGLKAAGTLVAQFGSLDAIPLDPSQWPALRGRDGLCGVFAANHRETLHCRDLLVLRDDAPIPYALEELRWRGVDGDAIKAVLDRLEAPPDLRAQVPG
jgi:5'-3' exonuclease